MPPAIADADVPPKQDMPPPGGYRKFNWDRTFPKLVWRREFSSLLES